MANPRRFLAATAVLFVTFAALIVLFGEPPADVPVRNAILAFAAPPVVAVLRVFNEAGNWRVLLPATVLLVLVFTRARRQWWLWCALMVAAPLAEGLMKILIRRPRPESPAFGFPSGHATAAAAFFGVAIYLAGSLPPRARGIVRVLACLAMLLVGLARVVLRAHWPSDVLAGFALGLALASLAAFIASSDLARPTADTTQ
jgi:undecaprenyl-diphosphatase